MDADEMIECAMCGRLHRIQRNYNNEPNVGNPDLVQAGIDAMNTAQQAARIAPEVINRGLQFTGFTENGIARNSIASGLHSQAGNLQRGSMLSSAQRLGARGGVSQSGWVAVGAAITVAVATAGKFAWDTYQAHRARVEAENERREQERRFELNLCEACWAVVRLSEEENN